MPGIDEFFSKANDNDAKFSHPRLQNWFKRIKKGESLVLELYRPPVSLGMSRTSMFIHFSKEGSEQSVEEVDWNEHLNSGLIQLKVKSIDQENEIKRFALGLRDGFRLVETEFGNGYFNAVLLDLIMESKLNEYPQISKILKHTYHVQPERTSPAYNRCRDAIALGISARAKELTGGLGYSEGEEAKEILIGAIAMYLDTRFSVSSRKQLGLLDEAT